MKINLDYVAERDIDLVLMRSIVTYPKIRDFFIKEAFGKKGYKNIEILNVSHSVDTELGESDIVIELKCNKGKLQIHIEDKIDAIAMPRQCLRYIERCERYVKEGKCIDYALFLVAPNDYLKTEKQPYPHRVSDEKLLSLLIDNKADKVDIELVKAAIEKKTHPTIVEDPKKTDFWMEYYEYINRKHPELVKYYSENRTAKGSRSVWHHFKTCLKGVTVCIKYNRDIVDIQLNNMAKQRTEFIMKYEDIIPREYDVATANKSLAIRSEIPHVDFNKSFSSQVQNVEVALLITYRCIELVKQLKMAGFRR